MAVTAPSFFMDIGKKNAYSAIDHFADDDPKVFLECCEEEGLTNRSCSEVFVVERILQK